MSYEVYKWLHLTSIFVFLSGAGILLVSESKAKLWKIITGIASFVILVAGMGLVARLQTGFQPWVYAKLGIWMVVSVLGHMVAKRFPSKGLLTYWIIIGLASLAAYVVIFRAR